MTDTQKAIEFFKESAAKGSILGLSRIYELLEKLGNPQEKIKVIHISGTNGKGSFSAMLSSVLSYGGYKVGSFSSPYLVSAEDSFRINSKTASEEIFLDTLKEVVSCAEKMEDSPTEFELMTAMAFLMFYKNKCDFALIECGLGGDGDSTNVMSKPFLSVITNVQKDHCHILGNSIAEIAEHKAGIIKKDCPVLYGGGIYEAFSVIAQKAKEMSAKLYVTDKECMKILSSDINGTILSFNEFEKLKLSLLGLYQTENAANVLTAVEVMRKLGVNVPDKAVYEGMANCKWQGRFEVVKKNPLVIFDGSHNPDGMRYTVQSIKQYFGGKKVVMLMGVMADKEYSLYGDMLESTAEIIFTVTPDNSRALESEVLAACFNEKGICAKSCKSVAEGVKSAINYAKENKLPLIALGSLYMYKEFSEEIRKY